MSEKKLAVLTSDPGGPVVRHRFLAYEDALAARGIVLDVVPWAKDVESRRDALRRVAEADGTVISSRLLTRRDVGRVRRRAAWLGFDYDDALPFRDSLRGAKRSRVRSRRFETIVRAADRVTAGNAYLAELGHAVGKAPTVLPTTVQMPAQRTDEPDTSEGIRVGWIGSRATVPYLAGVHARWLKAKLGRPVTLRVIADAAPKLPGVTVEFVRWTPTTWLDALRDTHLGIAPLPDDAWTRGKCGLKVLQMLSVGRPVIADPVGVQRAQIRDGINGFLPASPDEFSARLAELVHDDGLRDRLGRAGFEDACDRWSVDAWCNMVCDEYTDLLADV